MLVADVSKQTITKGCAVKDFLKSFVGIALNPIAMSICTEKNGGAIVVRAGWISASSKPITRLSRMRHLEQDFLTVVISLQASPIG